MNVWETAKGQEFVEMLMVELPKIFEKKQTVVECFTDQEKQDALKWYVNFLNYRLAHVVPLSGGVIFVFEK